MVMYLFAMFAGGLVVLSMVMNSRIARGIGVFPGVLTNFAVGLLTSAVVLALCLAYGLEATSAGALPPWYAYGGALLGIAIVAACNVVIPKIPVVYSAVLIFLGQMVTGLLLDALLAGAFDSHKAIGAALVTAGLLLNAWIDARPGRAGS